MARHCGNWQQLSLHMATELMLLRVPTSIGLGGAEGGAGGSGGSGGGEYVITNLIPAFRRLVVSKGIWSPRDRTCRTHFSIHTRVQARSGLCAPRKGASE
eukprot:6603816-Prymnesium_polylepis.1